jgi:glycosyltransferase EpsF
LACSSVAGEYLYGVKTFEQYGRIIKNGIDVESYLKQTVTPDDIDANDLGSVVFGNVSRFDDSKNQLFLLDVFYEILTYEPESTLLLGGVDGGQLMECIRKTEELEISDKVKFIGVRNDMPQVLSLIDVFIFPSLHEGFGIVLLEAQAAGCYCVASSVCPSDTDMGLERIDYISLAEDASIWARRILEGYYQSNKIRVDANTIRGAFDERKYSVSYLVKCMTDVYIGEKCE